MVFLEALGPTVRKSALPTESRDQPQLLQWPEVGEGGGRSHPQTYGDVLQAGSTSVTLTRRDDAKCLHLSMGEALEGLHEIVEL
ncbi:MAG TPA: hypothetical protein VK423_04340 [Thermoplasmata archaeon]|nr:hypothetical protein [Thermoplasmata archaeon]